MKKAALFILTLVCFLSSKSQLISDSILVDGHYRKFHFNKPPPENTDASLIFILHGSGGTGEQIMKDAAKLESISGKENVLLVYPDGYKNFWNECRKAATSAANLENINENKFFHLMIGYFKLNYHINSKHVFTAGFSGGGHMAYKLALTMPREFKAITAIVANLPDSSNMDCTASDEPVSVMIINGTNDPINPYQGGEVKITAAYLGNVRSTEQTFKYWATLDGFNGEPVIEYLPDTDPTDGKTIMRYSYKKKSGPEVVLLEVIGGKHDYPNDINVYIEAWEFFKRHLKK
ncbi:MAG: poly(3-hydroxybutyrate) depolymerase [Ferruginibacter sp.]